MDHATPIPHNQPHMLPIIDISPYLDGHDAHGRVSTSAALHAACLEYGFFYLDISNYVDQSEPDELIRLAREFFDLPQAEKDKIALKNEDHARGQLVLSLKNSIWRPLTSWQGYARLKENVTNGKADNHEGIDFYHPVENPDKTKPLWGENQWPSIPRFREKYEKWIGKMKALGLVVMEACVPRTTSWIPTESAISRMAAGLGMTSEEWKELRSNVDDSFWVMRVIGNMFFISRWVDISMWNGQDTLHCRTMTMVSHVVRTSIVPFYSLYFWASTDSNAEIMVA